MKITREKTNGITLIALIITIIILLILAGVTIASLGGENGLITKVSQAKKAQIKAEMREQLVLALSELQLEKNGEATLDDITQEWADSILEGYKPTITNDASISGKKITMSKSGIIGKYIIDKRLNITEIEETAGAELTYEVKSRDGENLQVLVTVTDNENGLQTIEYNDGHIQDANGLKSVSRDCIIQLGVEYRVKIISKSGEEKTEIILINDYYHTITKNLGEGINIDNIAVKTAYNQPYQATITTENDYIIDTLTVTMGGEEVTVDKTTGIIDIANVIGDIEITATARMLEIQVTEPIIGTENPPTSSVNDNSQTRGDTLYINFNATLEGTTCTIVNKDDGKVVPYAITKNGKYIFIATGTYNEKNITKEIEIVVNKYKSATGLVKYDAGDWTYEQIYGENGLNNMRLYALNSSHTIDTKIKLNDPSGFNFTFGGYTYKGDLANSELIQSGKIITSRNQSVNPQSGIGTTNYDGWQILEGEIRDEKKYVKKLIHAGTPENFVYNFTDWEDNYRVEYLLSNGIRKKGYNKLSDGTVINTRNWDMYKDKDLDEKGYIEEIHIMTIEEANALETDYMRKTGAYYWLASTNAINTNDYNLDLVNDYGSVPDSGGSQYCMGVRPVVVLVDNVYVISGTGTEADPYVLGMDVTE